MGMFDEVIVEVPLRDEGEAIRVGGGWQTKDFRCLLDKLYITPYGRLEITNQETDELTVDLDFHGEFDFYTSRDGTWYEYRAKFTNGWLQSITRLPERDFS